MDKQGYQSQGTYGQTDYSDQNPNIYTVPANNLIVFEEGDNDYKPTELLLNSIVQAREDRESGKASPTFSSVEEMKKWVEEHGE